jgi:hypothetical protein
MSSGAIDDRVRHGLDDVVEALDVLNVERRIDVDLGGEQLLNIHVALGMPALRRIRMRELIDEN